MFTKDELFKTNDKERIWQKYCGFFDLTLDEFMEIQVHFLLKEIKLVADSPIGKKIMNNQRPASVEEFRHLVPLTTYQDYAPYIGDCREDGLAFKPLCWSHTSGRGGSFKWAPYSEHGLKILADSSMATLILASADRKGEVKVREGDCILSILAPSPYFTGLSARLFGERFNMRIIPPPEIAEKLEFQERIQEGFKIAMRTGVDFIASVSIPLVKMGERFTEQTGGIKFSPFLLQPAVLLRLLRAWLRCKIQRRVMLPKDLWPVKGLACGGTDTALYKEKLVYYWGRSPYEAYGATEIGITAMQSWAKKGMTFYPYMVFFEFIPEEEWLKTREDKQYQPSTVLLNQVEPGKLYELVVTNFHGMPFLRYRLGDLVEIISLEEKETGIKIPQMTFKARADDIIHIYAIARLDERTAWQAIIDTGIKHEDWSMRKEDEQGEPIVRLYIELKEDMEAQEVARLVHDRLKVIDRHYNEAVTEVETNPIKVTLLPRGAFQYYYEQKRKAGADLAHLKPPHMNAPQAVIEDLVTLSRAGG